MTIARRIALCMYGWAAALGLLSLVLLLAAPHSVGPAAALVVAALISIVAFLAAHLLRGAAQRAVVEPLVNLARTASFSSEQAYYEMRLQHDSPDEVGKLVGAVNRTLEELSQQVRERERVVALGQETDRLRTEFLANVSHEMRTPLNAILGLTRLVRVEAELSPGHKRYLDEVSKAATRLVDMVDEALDFSDLEAGKLSLDQVRINLADILQGAARHAAVETSRKGLTVQTDVETVIPATVLGDPLRLAQILRILVSNAVKFTDRGQVRLEARLQGPMGAHVDVTFSVKDTGIGIPADKLALIFQPFGQVEGGLDRSKSGTGLGLAIGTKLVEALGGTLKVESEPGKGSTFQFTLRFPIPKAGAEPAPEPVETGDASELVPMAILLVEDNPVNQTIARSLLEEHGHSVELAGNGKEAVDAVDLADYDLILMDIQMPVMDGLVATAAIRHLQQEKGGRTPIIALTAQALKGDRERCLSSGMDGYVSKPIVPEVLWAAMALALRGATIHGPRQAPAPAAAPPPAQPPTAQAPPKNGGSQAPAGSISNGISLDNPSLLARVGGNARVLRKIVGQFIETAPTQLAEIEAAIREGEAQRVMETAHKFKGSAANFEAREVVEIALRLEMMGRDGSLAGAPDCYAQLKTEADGLIEGLGQALAREP